jgi:hypothetical protein
MKICDLITCRQRYLPYIECCTLNGKPCHWSHPDAYAFSLWAALKRAYRSHDICTTEIPEYHRLKETLNRYNFTNWGIAGITPDNIPYDKLRKICQEAQV